MTIIETIKFWWKIKKANRKLLKQVKEADRTPYETTPEDVERWIRINPFGITREDLNVSHMTQVTAPSVITFKEFEHGNR
jgi:hypothetical protein